MQSSGKQSPSFFTAPITNIRLCSIRKVFLEIELWNWITMNVWYLATTGKWENRLSQGFYHKQEFRRAQKCIISRSLSPLPPFHWIYLPSVSQFQAKSSLPSKNAWETTQARKLDKHLIMQCVDEFMLHRHDKLQYGLSLGFLVMSIRKWLHKSVLTRIHATQKSLVSDLTYTVWFPLMWGKEWQLRK